MKNFFMKLFAFVLALVLPFGVYFVYIQSFVPVSTASLMGASSMKLELVEQMQEPKMVLVGGSNVVYNLSAQQISQELGIPTYNMGTTAYLGLDFFISQIKEYANEGDIVVLSLESSVYSDIVDYQTVWMALENHENLRSHIPASYVPELILSYYQYGSYKYDSIQSGVPLLNREEGYVAAGFNEYGDYALPYPENILESLYNREDTKKFDASALDNSVLWRLNALHLWAKNNNIKLYLTYAPFNQMALQTDAEDTTGMRGVQAFEETIEAQCTIPWIGSYEESIMDAPLFFDSNNHLNSQGRNIRTADFISDFRELEF